MRRKPLYRWTGSIVVSMLASTLGAGVWLACGDQSGTSPAERPNIVLISIDTLRPDHLSVYGYSRPTSPHVDEFAAESVVFERAYSQSPKTAPSHMTLMTGLFPETHRSQNWNERPNRLSDEIRTLAMVLQEAGYRTDAITAGGNVRGELGFDRGFDTFRQSAEAATGIQAAAALIRERANPRSAPDSRPFFLFVHSYVVHDPYLPPERLQDRFARPDYAGKIVGSRRRLLGMLGNADWTRLHEFFWLRVDPSSPEDVQHLKDLYDSSIVFMDEAVGELLAALQESGLDANTLVCFTSDHGEEFSEHEGFLHETLYQEVLHVPLIIRFPGAEGHALAGRRVASLARLIDVMPTLLDWIGVPIPPAVQGRSLLGRVGGDDTNVSNFSQWRGAGVQSIQSGDWKMIHYRKKAPGQEQGTASYLRRADSEELFDLRTDPQEQINLADQQPERRQRLLDDLNRWVEQSQGLRKDLKPGRAIAPDEDTRRQLRALGYLSEDD